MTGEAFETEILRRLEERRRRYPAAERLLVTIDGPCASGKTTLAEKLAVVLDAAVVHTDDYVIPHGQKTPERLAIPGGNCDADRLCKEVVIPWKRGDTAFIRRYDCRNDRLLPAEKLPDSRILILEGSYSNLPMIREHADIRVFVNTPWKIRKERLIRRESPQSLRMFYDRWIPLEDRYFKAYGLPDRECILLANDRDNQAQGRVEGGRRQCSTERIKQGTTCLFWGLGACASRRKETRSTWTRLNLK